MSYVCGDIYYSRRSVDNSRVWMAIGRSDDVDGHVRVTAARAIVEIDARENPRAQGCTNT
jgi:hypothetical protein